MGYHEKFVATCNSFSSLKQKFKEEVQRRTTIETELNDKTYDLEAAKLQLSDQEKARKKLSELDDLKKKMAGLKAKYDKDVLDAHKAGFKEAK